MNDKLTEIVKTNHEEYTNLSNRIFDLIVELLYASQVDSVDLVVGKTYELWTMYPTCTHRLVKRGVVTSKEIEMVYSGNNFDSELYPEAHITVDSDTPMITALLYTPENTKKNIREALICYYPIQVVDELLELLYTKGFDSIKRKALS